MELPETKTTELEAGGNDQPTGAGRQAGDSDEIPALPLGLAHSDVTVSRDGVGHYVLHTGTLDHTGVGRV